MQNQVEPRQPELPASGFGSLDPKALEIFEATPQEIFIWDTSGTIIFANKRALDFHGLTLDRVRKVDLPSELYHPEDLPIVTEAIKKSIQHGEPMEVRARLLRKDGRYLWFIVRSNPVRDESGRIVRWYGTLTDVDDEVRAEDRLRLTIDTTPAMIHTALPDGGIDYFNQRWREYLGVASEEIVGWKWMSVVHPDEVTAFVDKWRLSLQTGAPFEVESRVRRADGTYRWLLHRKVPLRNKHGEIIKWYGSSMDIDDRKRAEDELRRSEALLAQGQRLSHTGSWVWNAASGDMTWSQERFRILGLDPEKTKASSEAFWEGVHPEDRSAAEAAFEAAIRNKRDYECDYRIVTPDWVIRHLHSVGHAVLNEAGELVEFIGTTMDVTERKRAEERAQSQQEAIRLALNALVEELDVDRFLEQVITGLTKQFQAAHSELWLLDESTGTNSLYMAFQQGKVIRSESVRQGGLQSRKPRVMWQPSRIGRNPKIFEIPADGALIQPMHRAVLKRQGVKTLMIIPLVLGEQNLGYFELRFNETAQFTPDDLDLAQALVHHATLALQLSWLAHRTEQMAVAEERNRLAREIHDTLAQAFAGIVLHTEALKVSLGRAAPRSKKSLSQIQKLARSGLDEARRSVQALRPKELHGNTLPQALELATNCFAEDAKILCEFKQTGKVLKVSPEVQNELFRIAKEAMTNIGKHARAKSAWITLEFKAHRIILTVRDDGVGFSTNSSRKRKPGYGLTTMRERSQRIGARLEIERPSTGGTTVRVTVPSAEKAKSGATK